MEEPATYTKLYNALKKSKKTYFKTLKKDKIDSHAQIVKAPYFAKRLEKYIKSISKYSSVRILDCGSGLGFITRELEKIKNFDVYGADPSISVKNINKKLYPKSKFIHCEIKNIPKLYNQYFDIIYLREVYPFTRTDNFKLHKKLLSDLFKKLKKNGFLIFEQIKNKKDLFTNLDKLGYNYQIHFLLPINFNMLDFLNIAFFKSKILQFIIFKIYKIFKKKVNHLIIIRKGADL